MTRLLTWADAIYVFDSGSVDNTWEIVQHHASRDKRVVPLRKDPVYFSDTKVRGYLFHHARAKMRNGDWFLRNDGDEIHQVTPPEFVRTRLAPHETIAWHQYYDFRLTASEADAWEAGRETLGDRARPIEERRRSYTVSVYAEPRLCRYRDTMRWPPNASFPYNSGYVARERLPIRHYPHRDPAQLQRRVRLRNFMMADRENRANWSEAESHHWSQEWSKFITPDDFPGLHYWQPGTEFPEVHAYNHLAPFHKRVVQRAVHAFVLPYLDRRRPHWPEDTYPQKITPEIIAQLERELKVRETAPC